MDKKVKKLYKEALKNKQFNKEFKEQDSEYKKPNMFSESLFKHFYVAIYEGWLIGKGEFKEEEYEI